MASSTYSGGGGGSGGSNVNPLRPYYIPPSIGDPIDVVVHASSTSRHMPSYTTTGTAAHSSSSGTFTSPSARAGPAYAHKARDLFGDLDYKDYLAEPSPSAVQSIKDVVDDLMWRYASILMAQPFEVARTLLQVHSQDASGPLDAATAAPALPTPDIADRYAPDPYAEFDSDPDEPSYFAQTTPHSSSSIWAASHPTRPNRRGAAGSTSSTLPATSAAASAASARIAANPQHLVLIKPGSIVEVLSQLWQREGFWGVWKGTNASFLYTVLQSLLENWSRSLLSALFNVPDLGLKNNVDRLVDIASPYPWASLCVAAAAAVATGLILAPLDLVRTRLVVTPTSRPPSRRALSILRRLPSYVCAPALVLPTVLHSLIHPLLTLSTPLVLRTHFMIDRDVNPVTFSIAKFCSSSLALFVKLPLETVLRRGQAAVASTPAYVQAIEQRPPSVGRPNLDLDLENQANAYGASTTAIATSPTMETILPLGRYSGVWGTMAYIVSEEGMSRVTPASSGAKGKAARKNKPVSPRGVAEAVYRRGQGMEGLWRGWKVSWWGLVGLWTAAAFSGGGDGQF